ncbi:hypothetical protein [Mesorhizobium sp. M1027]|uniref:hypothetical protein n=1 Tax=Mesorhizobium sp. M1027 TaxID=2957050 RepID=UPI0033382B1B
MSVDRTYLKSAIAAMLDVLAIEHPLGHQEAYVRRYILTTPSGKRIELMFEQSAKTPANIWLEASVAGSLLRSWTKHRLSPASQLYAKPGKNGDPQYGRHSALETMPALGTADLICMQPKTLAEAGAILDHLLGA